jgi:hypothetical protein
VGSGQWAVGTWLQCYTLHFAAPATQQPSDPAIQRLAPASSLQPPASSLQPPTSSLRQSSSLPLLSPQCSTAHLGLAGILDVGAWGLSVPLLLVSSYSLQCARPAPESRQTAERATNLMIPNRPPQTSPCCPIILPHRCSLLCYLRLARPCRRRLSAPTRDCPPPAHSSLSPTTEPRVTTAPCSALSISDCTGCSVLTALSTAILESSPVPGGAIATASASCEKGGVVAIKPKLRASFNEKSLLQSQPPPPTHLGQPREILE